MFVICFFLCLVLNKVFFEFGCSIGVELLDEVGFIGFLVELNKNDFEYGFFIVVYVVV